MRTATALIYLFAIVFASAYNLPSPRIRQASARAASIVSANRHQEESHQDFLPSCDQLANMNRDRMQSHISDFNDVRVVGRTLGLSASLSGANVRVLVASSAALIASAARRRAL